MKELVAEVARLLVDEPSAVEVREVERPDGTVLELKVAPSDLGRIIGRQGRTARSLRALVAAAASKKSRRYQLEILE